jgi:solute carrier family 25 (mitochondrial iron transporter), member 28/37
MHHSPYTGVLQCARAVFASEGWQAFYRSMGAQLLMNIPYQMVHLVTYDTLRKVFNPEGTYNPGAHLVAGAGAGALAAALTTPFDVAKTLLNTQELAVDGPRPYISGLKTALRTIHHTSGAAGFAKGLSARVLYTAPSAAISWSVYEFFKFVLASS